MSTFKHIRDLLEKQAADVNLKLVELIPTKKYADGFLTDGENLIFFESGEHRVILRTAEHINDFFGSYLGTASLDMIGIKAKSLMRKEVGHVCSL